MCNCCSEKAPDDSVTRRIAIKKFLILSGGVLLSLLGLFIPSIKAEAGGNRCSRCACPYFQEQAPSSNVCLCGHNYHDHW